MSKQALLNINILAAQKGAAELEFAVKKVHSLDSSKGPEGYVLAIERRVEDLVMEEVQKFQTEDNFLSCLLYTSPSPRDRQKSRMPSSA